MKLSKRDFLKLAAMGIVGVGVNPTLEVFAAGEFPKIDKSVKPNGSRLVGSRWAMVIDMTACKVDEGCTACMDECHQVHNVPNWGNIKDEVKWIWADKFGHVFPEKEHEFIKEGIEGAPFIVMCNHCDNPPCVRVCPTKATWKRESDGIVMMDMHRCIGCRFCMAACPYGSRSFNWRDPRIALAAEGRKVNPNFPTRTKGVVEKCNFCSERLAEGLMPACVEKCKAIGVGALHFGDLGDEHSELVQMLHENFTIRRKPELGTRPQVYYIVR